MKPTDKLKELYLEYAKVRYPITGGTGSLPSYFKQYSTTNGLTKCIIAYIRLNGWQAERINTTGRRIDNTKIVEDVTGRQRQIGSVQWIKSTGTKGSADISATILNGRKLSIEVKNEKTKDKQSELQKTYQKQIELVGGIYCIAKNLKDFIEWFDSNVGKNKDYLQFYKFFIDNKIVI